MKKLSLRFYFFLLFALPGALHSEQYYLITETELSSIESYKTKSAADKQSWLSQVRDLKAESERLNAQLKQQRELNSRLTQSFNRYEQDRLTLISSKNGEIAQLKSELTDRLLTLERVTGQRNTILIIVSAVGILGALCIVLRIKKRVPIFV